MDRFSRDQIRAIVLFGFALSAVAAVINLVNDVNSVGFPHSFHGVFDSLLNPITTTAAVFAWSWLTLLQPRDEAQLRIIRVAYLFFAIQYLFVAVGYNFIFTPIHSFGGIWITTYLWLDFLGAVIVTFGLFLTFRFLGTLVEIERPSADVEEIR